MNELLIDSINTQIGVEGENHSKYMGLFNEANEYNFIEIGNLFLKYAKEELEHRMKFIQFLTDLGIRPQIPAIPASEKEEKENEVEEVVETVMPMMNRCSIEDLFEKALIVEKETTIKINELKKQAFEYGDFVFFDFLVWFTNEQFESETTLRNILSLCATTHSDALLENLIVEKYM